MDDLNTVRAEINEIDEQMTELFVRRMEAAGKVAAYKGAHGLPIHDAIREGAIIERHAGSIADEEVRGHYVTYQRALMQVSCRYQERLLHGLRVAFCGVSGAFAHIAAEKIFPCATHIPLSDFRSAYDAVENGDCDCAVLPIENSTAGEVGQVLDLMFSGSLYVNGVYDLSVNHCLIGTPDASEESIAQVISHPQALAQCAPYLRERGWRQIQFENTAMAAKHVAEENDPSIAAIASEETARLYGLKIIARNIHSSGMNTTRFAVLSRSAGGMKGREGSHSILMFTVRNEAGSLARAIGIIGGHGYNMRCLRSRPMKELVFQYYFYVEAEGDLCTEEGRRMTEELASVCDRVRVLGSFAYPALLGGEV